MSRRRHLRYPLRAVAVYGWEDQGGMRRQGRGWTKDIGEEGVYVLSSECPSKGNLVKLLLRFPPHPISCGGAAAQFNMNGDVLRVDHDAVCGRDLGFAVRKNEIPSPEENSRSETFRGSTLLASPVKAFRAN